MPECLYLLLSSGPGNRYSHKDYIIKRLDTAQYVLDYQFLNLHSL